jgi:hypothetical protein
MGYKRDGFVYTNVATNKKIIMIFTQLQAALYEYQNNLSSKKSYFTPDFNLLEILAPKELQLSKLFAEFLNPNGTHEQNSLFLNEFIKTFLPNHKKLIKEKNINVLIELAENVNGRIDILIDFDNNFGIAIENKPFADDQDEQIIRYVEYLENTYGKDNYSMLYLSAYGTQPTEKSLPEDKKRKLDNKFVILSYEEIKDWLLKCANLIPDNKSPRLKNLLLEIVEYINITFLNTNSMKNKILKETIENNILEAFEINKIWLQNKKDLEQIYFDKLNRLFNEVLPDLLFKELKNRNVINHQWEFIKGDFDINKRNVSGFYFKKKDWKEFKYGILKSKIKTVPGTADIFPAILTKKNPKTVKFINKHYLTEYAKATNSEIKTELWSNPPIIWWSEFPDKDYKIWNYKQWSEIKENGETVIYVADFLEKLINISVKDIEKMEYGKL